MWAQVATVLIAPPAGDAAMASATVLEMNPVPMIAQRSVSAIGGEARAALPMPVHERFGGREEWVFETKGAMPHASSAGFNNVVESRLGTRRCVGLSLRC